MKTSDNSEKSALVSVKLTGSHIHQRDEKKAGDIITVRPDQAERLIKAEKAVRA